MPIFKQLVGLFWLIFYAYWLLSAIGVKRNVSRSNRGWGAGIRLLIFVGILVFLNAHHSQHVDRVRETLSQNFAASGIGAALCAAGIGFAIWARRHIGRNWGMPMSVKLDPELVMSGPYALVRHPIYSGILLAMAGSALTLGAVWLIPFGVFCAYAVYSAKAEERLMAKEFPEEYPRYRKNTKLLVPFVL